MPKIECEDKDYSLDIFLLLINAEVVTSRNEMLAGRSSREEDFIPDSH
jgi:hypothetical protein